jgi:lipopolysaccharide export system permease protein
MKVLFITSNRVGDAVLSTGVLAWIVARYPGVKVTVACGPHAADLFRAVPGLERLIILRKKMLNLHWIDLWMNCIGTRWDMIIDLRNSVAARLLRAKRRAQRTHSTGEHKVVENARILDLAPPPAPHIWLDAQAERQAAQLLPQRRPCIALGPAANWPPKQWPVENFLALAQQLTAKDGLFPDAPVLVIAGESERAAVASLLSALPPQQCVSVIGYDLLTVAACLKECALFIGNDSGLMHMAAATGIPTLGLFGPGYEKIYGPWGPRCAFVRTPENREELLRRLPSPGASAPNLMQGLSVENVIKAVHDLLGKPYA